MMHSCVPGMRDFRQALHTSLRSARRNEPAVKHVIGTVLMQFDGNGDAPIGVIAERCLPVAGVF